MKHEAIRRQFEREPMYRSESPSIQASEVTDGGGDAAIRFRRFRLLPRARQLFVDGEPADLGSRAFDLLMVLIKAPGKLVTKSEILAQVTSRCRFGP
jgi:DNA-binding response OmpR family regulator